MAVQAVVLISSSVLAAGTFTGSSKQYDGGRSTLVINAAAYGALVQLQVMSFANSSVWIPVNSGSISADQCIPLDVPPGTFRIIGSGSTAGMNAVLVQVVYG